MKGMIGSINRHRTTTKIRTKKIEYLSKAALICENRCGSNEKKIFDPSRGGTGTRLNTARAIFITTRYVEITRKDRGNAPLANRIIRPKIRAMRRFEPGPAIEIKNSPTLRFFILYGFHSTGFAHPKVNPAKEVSIGTTIEPNGSICLRGFNVRRPCKRGVGSPKRSATYP